MGEGEAGKGIGPFDTREATKKMRKGLPDWRKEEPF
jgi:hypothetical protein